jgi:hypothetical protein
MKRTTERVIGGVVYLVFLMLYMWFIMLGHKIFHEMYDAFGVTLSVGVTYLSASFAYWYVYFLLGTGVFAYFFLYRKKTLYPCVFIVGLTLVLAGYYYFDFCQQMVILGGSLP